MPSIPKPGRIRVSSWRTWVTNPRPSTNNISITYPTTPKTQQNAVKPPSLWKTNQLHKTKEKIVENNWHSSFGQFGKIELTEKSRQARLPSRAFAFNRNKIRGSKPNPNLLNNLSKTAREGATHEPATSNQQPATSLQVPPHLHRRTPLRQPQPPPENFCYFHHTTRKPITPETQKERRRTTARLNEFHLPLPEDRSAIQSSSASSFRSIASNDLDPRRAGLLLYALQIASLNLPKQQAKRRRHRRTSPGVHHRPRIRHPRPTNRNPRKEKLHRAPPRRAHQASTQTSTRSPTPDSSLRATARHQPTTSNQQPSTSP